MELPSFLQFAAFLKKKKGSPTGDEKAKNGGSTTNRPSPTSDELGLVLPTNSNVSSQDAACRPNSFVGLIVATGENAPGTIESIIQNESLRSSQCDRETCNILSTRFKKLEETLAGKEKELNILREELATCKDFSVDASTGMLSFGMEADYVTHIERYQKRLEEFAEAVKERDGLIVQLSEKLKSSNEVRAALQTKEEQLAQDVALLQKQLHHTKEIVEGHVWDTGIKPQDFLSLQSQLLALEDTVTKNKSVINGLNAALQQRDMALQAQAEELDKKSQELSQHKTKSAKEIQELMREVEELNQRSVLATSTDSQNLADLRAQLEEEFGLQLVQIKDEFRNQLDEKDQALLEAGNTIVAQERQLADTVTVFKSEILSYKQQVDALNVERQEAASMVDRLTSELGSYNVDLALQKEQNQAINERVKEMSERNEKLSLELQTLQCCQQEDLLNYNRRIEDLTLQLQQSKERLGQGDVVLASEESSKEGQRLKCQLADIQEKHIKEMNQLRQSYSKELESFRQRNTFLEFELDNITRNKEKCTAELNACKEAYIAQWGSSKHAQDMEIVGLKEQISALKVQIQEVMSVQDTSDNFNSNVETSKASNETEANRERESLKLQLKECLLAQDSLSREITGHKLEIAMYKQEKECLQQSLREVSVLEERHRLVSSDLQRELVRYRQQIEDLNQAVEKQSALNREYQSTISSKEQERLRESDLQDELSRVSELLRSAVRDKESLSKRLEASTQKYREEMASYEEKLRSINLEVDNLTKGHLETLSSYHEAQSLNNLLGNKIQALECEVLSYKEQLEIGNVKAVDYVNEASVKHDKQLQECKENIDILLAQSEESTLVINTYVKELKFWDQQIRELNSQLAKELNFELPDNEVNISTDEPIHEHLVTNIKDHFTTLKHFIKSREESFHSATSQLGDSTLKLLSAQSTLPSMTENKQLHENSFFTTAVGEELADIKQQLIERERLLEEKTNSELALQKKIENLESKLVQLSTNSASIKECLQETTVKLVAAEALGAAKDELEIGLKNRIIELEDALHKVNEDSLSIRLESDQVTEKVAKAKDLLERMRGENNELSALCKLYEDDASQLREQLLLSEQRVKNLLSQVKPVKENVGEDVPVEEVCREQNAPQLSAQSQHSEVLLTSAAHTGHKASQQQPDLGNLAFQIQQFEKYQDELVMRCNRYEEEVAHLRRQLVTSENSLESLRQEVSNNKSSQSLEQNIPSLPNRDESLMVQAETSSAFNKLDMILSGGDTAPLNEYSLVGRGFDFGFNMSGQALNSTEYMGMDDLKTNCALKLIENCSFLENVRNELVGNVQDLQAKLQEYELNEKFYKEELELSHQRCKVFEAKVADLSRALETLECKVVSQKAIETKVLHLESENTILQEMQVNLHNELVTKQVTYEENLSKMLREQLSNSIENTLGATLEEMILELGSQAKEVIILAEKLKSKEESETALKARLQVLEESYQQLTYCKDEMLNVRKELEESWQKQCQTENELARVRKELAITQLSRDQLEKRWSRLKDISLDGNLESSKVSVLKQALQRQASNNKSLMEQSAHLPISTADNFSSSSYDLLDNHITTIREKLVAIIQKNDELFADGIDGAESGKIANDQSNLTAELSAYREQHATLAEVLGSTAVLQEALHRQKQELLQKAHEKAAIDELTETERTKLHEYELKIQMLYMEMQQKDNLQMEVNHQKTVLADELKEIEEKLSERECVLQDERRSLEAEIRQRDLSIRQWRLKCRTQQVEHGTEQVVSRMTASPLPSPRGVATRQLDQVKSDLNAAHTQTLQRMRNYLAEQFSTNERKLQKSHRAELLSIREEHQKKLATIQRELQDKTKELEALKQLEKQPEQHQLVDLDEWKNKLDEHQKEIYTEMQQQFETYARHKIEAAMKRLQDEHELTLSSQKAVHEEQVRELQSKLEQQKEVELLSIKQTLTEQHNRELTQVEERVRSEIAHHKDLTSPFPTDSKAAMFILKQLVCAEFTTSFKVLIDSRHETYRREMAELISQLKDAMSKEHLNNQAEIPQLLDSQEKLLTQTEELLARVVTEHQCMLEGLEAALDAGHEKLQAHLKRVSQETEIAATLVSLQDKIDKLEEEKQELLEQHTTTVDLLTTNHSKEVARLQELVSVSGIECGPCLYLRHELEAKHTSEMEELRQYFEKKCTELEKHYSEEVFSQHSRKLSSSSSCESELASDIYFTGGEQGHRINTLTHMCDSYTIEPSYKELEEHYQRDYEKRIVEYREQLDTIKHSIEEKYCSEMETLKEGYDIKVEELVRELAANHSAEIKELEGKHLKEMENLRTQLGAEAKKNEENAKNEAERLRHELELSHLQDLEKLKKTFEDRLNVDVESLTDRMLQDEADHIRIVKEEMQEKHENEVARLMAALEESKSVQLRELEEKHRAELERERTAVNEQVEQLTAMVKLGAEHEQEAFLKAQKEMMQGFVTKHQDDLKALKDHHDSQLRAAQEEVRKLQQEHAEYNEQIVQSKRRLHDEIQHDVLKALEDQLQVLLSEEVDEKSWPAELQQLQDKMTARYKRKLATLQHDTEALRNELERVRSMKDSVHEPSARTEPVESVGVKQMAATLKCVIGEIVQYMSVCEEELNNTLVNEILKYDWENTSASESTRDHASIFRDAPNDSNLGLFPNISPITIGNLNLDDKELPTHGHKSSTPRNTTLDGSCAPSENESYSLERKVPRRVHFAPDISTIFSMDENSLVEYMDNKNELSTDFRTELDTCLERLKAEAAALMGLSAAVPKQSTALEERITALSRQLASEVKAKEDLTAQLGEFEALKEACVRQKEELEKLSADLQATRERVTELESREDVTEGYGEQVSHNSLREGLAQLQDQAETAENEGGVKSPHLHLVEELIREGDRLMEEAKHEKDDLKQQVSFETSPSIAHMACCQQIAAADKQLRSNRQFLEQQALEREQERDEYLHEIENLREQLKATDKDRSSNYRRAKEDARPETTLPDNVAIADSLEAQMKEVTGNLQEAQVRKDELEAELKAAIEKVWVLRDIITELESQVEIKSRHEATLRKQVEDLEAVLHQQNQTNQDLMRQLDSGNGELAEHVAYLEEQLHLHRQQMEHLQPDSVQVKQMKSQLREFETTLDKKTKDLESLYTTTLSNTSCSSPSEDVSFRDHLDVMRCATPDEAPVSLPLDQLVRVQEKLNTHSRAEQAALKRIRDLEMQVKKLKSNEEEVTAERDVLQNQVEEQLLKISSIKAHLDEQRTKADELVQQASVDLEARLHRREMEIRDLKEAVENKNKQVAVAQGLLDETRQAVAAQEAERSSRVKTENIVVTKLKREYNKLKAASGKILQGEVSEPNEDEQDGGMGKYIPIPVLIDTMLATKNAELEALSRKVDELEQQLRAYMSLDLTDEQRAKLNGMLKDVKATKKFLQGESSGSKKQDGTSPTGTPTTTGTPTGTSPTTPAAGSAEMVPGSPRSTEVLYERERTGEEEYSSGAESDMDENDLRNLLLRKESLILSLKNQLAGQMTQSLTDLRTEMDAKDKRIAELEAKMTECSALEEEIKSLRDQLQEAIEGVAQDKEEVKSELEKLSTSETRLKADLAEREARVAEREAALLEKQKQIEDLQRNISQKDVALRSLSMEKETTVNADDYDKLEMELENERRSTKALKDELNQLRAENDRLQSELDVLLLKSDKVDALAGKVRKELDRSADLDQKMLDRLDDMATRDGGLACSPSLTQILNKVLHQGIDALTFDELSKLHQRTCAATTAMIMQNSTGRLPLEMVPTSMSPDQQGADKGLLCRRITALESEIKQRQEDAKQNMCHLENKIRNEEKRLHEMRQVLMEEQRRNIDLHSKLGNQNRRESELESERDVLRRQSTYQEERLQQFILSLEREKNKVRCLEENLQKERNNTRQLQSMLETDRFRGRNANMKESDLIETMRIKLENALDNEAKIRIRNDKLESQLRRFQMQPSTCPAPCNPANRQYNNDMQSLLDAEVEKCGSLELALKREQLQVEQLQVQLDRERQQAIERLETEREKREKLMRQISTLEEEKENLNLQLDTARESLCGQRLISESLERKLSAMHEMDIGKQRRRDEDDEKNRKLMEKQRVIQFDLEQKVLDLQREVADLRDEISAGGDVDKLSNLRQQLSESLQREQQLIRDQMSKQPLDTGLSAPLLQKLKSMNSLLETHVEENASVMAAMNQINLERQHLQDQVKSLEAQLANRSRSRNLENETEIVNGILAAERTTWARERAGLDQALLLAEARANRALSENISKDDQARHLFGKYLRVESYRKALIWQKRYLLVVLSGYQEAEAKTVKRLSRMAQASDAAEEGLSDMSNDTTLVPSRQGTINRFKSCGLVVVAVHRMHYMVRRWRHSRQLGSTILYTRGSTESIPSSTQSSYFNGPRRKGSTSSCWSVPRSLSHADVPNLLTRESRVSHSLAHSMSSREHHNRGSSSPTAEHVLSVRERYNTLSSSPNREQHMLRRWEADHVQHLPRRSESVPESSPIHIAEYINRFDQLQQTLSLNVAHMPSMENKLPSHTRHPPSSS